MKLFSRKGFVGWTTIIVVLVGITAVLAVVFTDDAKESNEIQSPPPDTAEEVTSLGVKPQRHQCEIAELPRDGKKAVGNKISSDGEFAIGELEADGDPHSTEYVRWRDGRYDVVADDKGEADYEVVDVNSSGAVLGDTDDYDGGHGEHSRAWIHDEGGKTWLKFPGAERVRPADMNDAGNAVANADDVIDTYPGDDEPTEVVVTTPLLWMDSGSEPVELEVEAGKAAEVVAVTDGGMALGYQYDLENAEHRQPKHGTERPWVWASDGEGWPLPDTTAPQEPPYAVDVSGDWVLWVVTKGVAYRWRLSNPGKVQWLNEDLIPEAIDGAGRVYGFAYLDDRPVPARQDDAADLVELPTFPAPEEMKNGTVYDASRDGSVLTGVALEGGEQADPASTAATWTCGG